MKIKSKGEFDDVIGTLDEQQLVAVKATLTGPVVVLAGPGSGKTRVLAARYAYLVNKKKVDPDSIVAVTFSTEMAKEMTSRVLEVCPTANEYNISTIHAFCKRLLKDEWFDKRSRIEDWKIRDAIRKTCDSLQWNIGWRTVRWWIDHAKMNGVGIETDALDFFSSMHNAIDAARLNACYRAVKMLLTAENAMTYVDMITDAYYNLSTDKKSLKGIRNRIRYILVDEGQDVFKMAMDILKLITDNIFIVGDQDQTLYRFLGARPEHLYRLGESGTILKLENNYRSHPAIVTAARNLISHNYTPQTIKYMKELNAKSSLDKEPMSVYLIRPSPRVCYKQVHSPLDEAEYVVETISKLKYKPNDCFVAYRTNAQSAYIERELIRCGIPYTIRDSEGFFSRHHVLDVLAYIRLAVDNGDNDAFMRVYNIPSTKLVETSASYSRQRWLGKNFIAECDRGSGSLYHGMLINRLGERHRELSKDIAWMIGGILGYKDFPEDAIEFILSKCYIPYYLASSGKVNADPSDDDSVLDDLRALKIIADGYNSLEKFIEEVDRMEEEKSIRKASRSSVVLSSIHKLKGLERNVVFCIGWSEGLLPHSRSIESYAANGAELTIPNFNSVEDERCAAFVAITRAAKQVYITSIESYNGAQLEPSRFIAELSL